MVNGYLFTAAWCCECMKTKASTEVLDSWQRRFSRPQDCIRSTVMRVVRQCPSGPPWWAALIYRPSLHLHSTSTIGSAPHTSSPFPTQTPAAAVRPIRPSVSTIALASARCARRVSFLPSAELELMIRVSPRPRIFKLCRLWRKRRLE